MENVLEKILEEIKGLIEKHKNKAYELVAREPLTQCYTVADIEQIKVHELAVVRDIIRKHMDNNNLHEKCSRRKWYQIGYKDGKNDGWIPVEERMPTKEEFLKDDGRFILDDGNRRYQGLFDIYDGKFKFSRHISGIHYELFEDKCVIAWQPLPEPYKQE
ncbi:hypothetical protein [Mediterraneibacter gnavus]|uniref:hypothetical protein n=1 Tax=Mediterraneibacter gnavus TaxID=33038 RepID=UPI0039843D07